MNKVSHPSQQDKKENEKIKKIIEESYSEVKRELNLQNRTKAQPKVNRVCFNRYYL